MTHRRIATAVILLLFLVLNCKKNEQSSSIDKSTSSDQLKASQESDSKSAEYAHPNNVYFGDTHLHTALSFDAGMIGATLMPSDGYRFAKGQEVTSNTGQRVKLSKPLDFVVVADHSDNLGFAPDFFSGAPNILADPKGKRWYDMTQAGKAAEAFNELLIDIGKGQFPDGLKYKPGNPGYASAWETIIVASEEANHPGVFTAFIGYEWTSMPGGNNIHRNVIYRDGGDKARTRLPYLTKAYEGSDDPRDLWKWMAEYEDSTGGRLLAIPHNGNVSNGIMFPYMKEPYTDRDIDKEYASNRIKWEPLYEVTQTKGDGEAHPFLSPNDEFADYYTWDIGNVALTEAKTDEMLDREYARSALKNGLSIEQKIGVNPYKFGLVGSTDSHLGIPAVEEDNFFGKSAAAEPAPDRWEEVFIQNKELGLKIVNWEAMASGYAAVWATENTREALFDAMERKETYATTGSRLKVRFFGGWDFKEDDASIDKIADAGYAKGVPMGGELRKSDQELSPTFLVSAVKDPDGANIDRIQIIKGWLDEKGDTHEKVFNVVWSGERELDENGKLPDVGNTVDLSTATYTNTIGSAELVGIWKDPEFDSTQSSFYYVRVLEIPIPRWTAHDAVKYGIKMDKEVPMITQKRAYTSPIWYSTN